jgi:hypothetical protein
MCPPRGKKEAENSEICSQESYQIPSKNEKETGKCEPKLN